MLDSQLEFKVRSGSLTYTTQVYIPNQAALSEALFPDARLSYMYVGRHWQKEVFSPFKSPGTPVELVEAEVVAIESLQLGEEILRVMRIEYRGLPGPGIPEANRLQSVTWVEPKSGMVLRQDVYIANSKLRFERLPAEIARTIGLEFFPGELGIERSRPTDEEFSRHAGSSSQRGKAGVVPAGDGSSGHGSSGNGSSGDGEVITSIQNLFGKIPAFSKKESLPDMPRNTPLSNPPAAARRLNTQ